MTEVKLETITTDNYLDVVRLKVSPSQEDLVANNLWSLAQAYVFDYASPFALYSEDRAVGFAMLSLEDIKDDVVWLWRFLIGHELQGQGYGTAAMLAIIEHVRAMPDVTKLRLSHDPRKGGAGPFYVKLGFTYTGEIEHDEPVMELDVSK
jgi:diamine N-acetyltransferase